MQTGTIPPDGDHTMGKDAYQARQQAPEAFAPKATERNKHGRYRTGAQRTA